MVSTTWPLSRRPYPYPLKDLEEVTQLHHTQMVRYLSTGNFIQETLSKALNEKFTAKPYKVMTTSLK